MSDPNLDRIADQLESPNSRDRLLGLTALRDVSPVDAVPLIKKVLNDDHLQVRTMAVFALGLKPTEECFDLLMGLLADKDYSIRANAAGALGYLHDTRAVEPLIRLFYEDTDWLVRFSAAVSLGNLGDPRARKTLIDALDSPEVIVQQAAIAALGEVGAVEAVERMLTFVQSDDWLVRQRLAESLGKLPSEKSRSALKYLAKDSHPQVAEAARYGLQQLDQLDQPSNPPADQPLDS
jgi:HEAT repeat protein